MPKLVITLEIAFASIICYVRVPYSVAKLFHPTEEVDRNNVDDVHAKGEPAPSLIEPQKTRR